MCKRRKCRQLVFLGIDMGSRAISRTAKCFFRLALTSFNEFSPKSQWRRCDICLGPLGHGSIELGCRISSAAYSEFQGNLVMSLRSPLSLLGQLSSSDHTACCHSLSSFLRLCGLPRCLVFTASSRSYTFAAWPRRFAIIRIISFGNGSPSLKAAALLTTLEAIGEVIAALVEGDLSPLMVIIPWSLGLPRRRTSSMLAGDEEGERQLLTLLYDNCSERTPSLHLLGNFREHLARGDRQQSPQASSSSLLSSSTAWPTTLIKTRSAPRWSSLDSTLRIYGKEHQHQYATYPGCGKER